MYLRFVAGTESGKPHLMHGLFTEAEALRKKDRLYAWEDQLIQDIFDYFNTHLPCPPFEAESYPERAVSWFKDDAKTFIQKMYDIKAILDQHQVPVRVLRTETLYKIVYEDTWQVVGIDKRF